MGKNKSTSIALGFFDGVHRGHQAVVARAVELAGAQGLTPCVFTFTTGSATPQSKRGYAAITTGAVKEKLLRGLGITEIICPEFARFQNLTGEEFVRDLLCAEYGARAICCGDNFHFGKGARWGVDDLDSLCKQYGVQLAIVPAVLENDVAVSSTRVREQLAAGNIPAVNALLGRSYAFCFEVAHGRRLGRKIDAPTINQAFPAGFALPRFGVYASFAQVDGVLYPSVTNIGVKATVVTGGEPLAETHISGVSKDLYGKMVPVYLVQFQRPEMKFASIEELAQNIRQDTQEARSICHDFALQKGQPVLYL